MIQIKIIRKCDCCDVTTSFFNTNRVTAIGFNNAGKPIKQKEILCDDCFNDFVTAWEEINKKREGE